MLYVYHPHSWVCGGIVDRLLALHLGEPNSIPGGSCRTMPLVGGFSRGYPVSPALAFRRRSTYLASIGSQDHDKVLLKNLPTKSKNIYECENRHMIVVKASLEHRRQSVNQIRFGAYWLFTLKCGHVTVFVSNMGSVVPRGSQSRGYILGASSHSIFGRVPRHVKCRVYEGANANVSDKAELARREFCQLQTRLTKNNYKGLQVLKSNQAKNCFSNSDSRRVLHDRLANTSFVDFLDYYGFRKVVSSCIWGRKGNAARVSASYSVLKESVERVACPAGVTSDAVRLRGRSPPTTAIRVRSPDGSLPDFHTWESCWTIPLASGFSRGTPVSPALAFQCRSILGSHLMSCPGITGTYGSASRRDTAVCYTQPRGHALVFYRSALSHPGHTAPRQSNQQQTEITTYVCSSLAGVDQIQRHNKCAWSRIRTQH
ncbi:hypothetical protein PR048_032978 [Dryococelus australis]|uniref:HSF-type DNA-binding domain-containing protein n=1 Tax=Dryococelus australis TaxID=614101 RepID=A0ABQ9G3R3_9NEOP|nr:hypothetical protein PR048_032978 [Dryococelus australis]